MSSREIGRVAWHIKRSFPHWTTCVRCGCYSTRWCRRANRLRYIDSGSRDPRDSLAVWLNTELTAVVSELRWQSGYFSADGLGPFIPTIDRLSTSDKPIHAVIGSNDSETLQAHVADLATLLRLPRSNARLGVVNFSSGLYHPKTYHLRREDGSQAAYVGSANLSVSGIGSQNIEAGLIIDSREGDSSSILDAIAAGVDVWFDPARSGLEIVEDVQGADRLQQQGILAAVPVPRPPKALGGGVGGTTLPRPSLKLLVPMPRRPRGGSGQGSPGATVSAPTPVLPAVPQYPFPPYVLFAPGQNSPTRGATALSGATLPGGYVGLVIRLNRDSTRHWRGAPGTANISIPVPSIPSLRFGMYEGRYARPRAEFSLTLRYLATGGAIVARPAETNIMIYGFAPGESGHGDVRLVLPTPPEAYLRSEIVARGLPLPQDGDIALLHWPTMQDPQMRLTFLEGGSPLFNEFRTRFVAAEAAGELVGRGACWLPAGFAPPW